MNEAALYDAGNQLHVEQRAKTSSARERQADEDFKWLMADPRGRRLMWRRLADAGIFVTSMSATPEATAFREGRRDLGLADLARVMRLCPEQYARMAAEAQPAPTAKTPGESPDEHRDDA